MTDSTPAEHRTRSRRKYAALAIGVVLGALAVLFLSFGAHEIRVPTAPYNQPPYTDQNSVSCGSVFARDYTAAQRELNTGQVGYQLSPVQVCDQAASGYATATYAIGALMLAVVTASLVLSGLMLSRVMGGPERG